MDKENREEWSKHFQDITRKIDNLCSELEDNKDIKEFANEMEKHINNLKKCLETFKEQVQAIDQNEFLESISVKAQLARLRANLIEPRAMNV